MNTPPIATGGRGVTPATAELADIPRWVLWRQERVEGRSKPTRVPYLPAARKKASSTDPHTWNDFDTCWKSAFVDGAGHGIGIVVDGSDDLMAADIDGCVVVPETQTITAEASEIVRLLNSYTELSPSGKGLRIFFRSPRDAVDWGRKEDGSPKGGRVVDFKGEHLELYRFDRFLTVTGAHLPGTPETIDHVAPEILTQLLGGSRSGKRPNGAAGGRPEQLDSIPEPTEKLSARFKEALRSDAELLAIWRGEAPPAGSDQTRSAWDLKLAGALRRHDGFTLEDFAAIASRWKHGKGTDGDPRHFSRTWAKAAPDDDQFTQVVGKDKPWPEPEPLPEGLPTVDPFPLELLPGAIRPWIEDSAERTQAPPDYIAVAVMVALGSVLGRQITIRPKRSDDWTVVPNLWGAVIGPPGVLKTPALEEALRHLRAMECAAKQTFDEESKIWASREEVDRERKKLRGETIKKRLKDKQDPDTIARDLAADTVELPPPTRRRFLANDATIEKLGELLHENPNGVLLYRDELMGWLRGLETEGREGARAFFLEAWNGTGRFVYDRIGRGTIDIEATCIGVLGGIQPAPLLAYLASRAWEGGGADGLLQRFQLAVWPDISREWRNVDRWPNSAAREQAGAVFKRFASIAREAPSSDAGLAFVRFDPEAQRAFETWRAKLERRLRAGDLHPALEAHLAKYRSLLPAVALICHLADHPVGPVDHLALCRAEAWIDYLETHARRIYDALLRSDQAAARALGERINDLPSPFRLRDVYRPCWGGLATKEVAQEAVDTLADLGWLRAEQPKAGKSGGRPAALYHVNPKLRTSP